MLLLLFVFYKFVYNFTDYAYILLFINKMLTAQKSKAKVKQHKTL